MKKKSRVKEGADSEAASSHEPNGDLRQLIEDNEQSLYDFGTYLLYGMRDVDELILSIFREFGNAFRKHSGKRGAIHQLPSEARLQLFHLAWERIRELLGRNAYSWNAGRDTRDLKGLDDDILREWDRSHDWEKIDAAVLERLSRTDPDFRAPLVLRDILHFQDDEVIQILGLRWGVYRHRLHRGRLEFRDALRGVTTTSEKVIENAI